MWLSPSFVRLDPAITSALGRSFPSHAVVAATVAFAQRAGARVIATEVASDRQLTELVGLGVDLVQGPIVGPRLHLSELREAVAIKDRGGGADDG
jgi:EAL domain-containing protein (putative c-di-GMP-specific phosphodiesterase class I)